MFQNDARPENARADTLYSRQLFYYNLKTGVFPPPHYPSCIRSDTVAVMIM